MMHTRWQLTLAGFLSMVAPGVALAQQTVSLREQFPIGYLYHVSSRVELSGSLTLPPEKGQAGPKTLAISGNSAIDYDERVLVHAPGGAVQRSLRIYRRMDFQRKVGEQAEQNTIRPEARRMVLLRRNQVEVPFSPDGPLTWGELDLVRTDVFTPALAGLLPERAARVGERWTAAAAAIQELTDMERIDEGSVTCTLEGLTNLSGRLHARVGFSGTVKGPGEDGPTRHQLEGYLFFDTVSNHVSYLSMRGAQSLLDKDGQAVGKVEGTFVLTRQPLARCAELADESLRGASLEPNESNTLLLYDNPELGVRFLYPRHWRVAGVRGRQVALDESRGSGLLLTLEAPARLPTGAQFLQESRTYLQSQKATVLRIDPVRTLQQPPRSVEQFGLEMEAERQRVQMDYYVIREATGGATLAARLMPAGGLPALQREVQAIAQSVRITRQLSP